MVKLLLVACFACRSLLLSSAADKEVDSFLPGDSESSDDTCMMQVPDMKIRQVGTDKGHQEVHPARDVRYPDRAAFLYTGFLRQTSQSYLPVTAALVVIGLLVAVYILHNSILAAFQNLPFISTLFYFGLLLVFCCSMLPVMWLGVDVISRCGAWMLISSYIAIMVLMSTPIILLMPDLATRQKLGHHWFGASEQVQTQRPAGDKQKTALLYLIIFALQIISGISIFQIAKLIGEDDLEQNLPGQIITTLLYAILSWCSVSVLYERMFPQRSFAADFPSHVFQQAFIGSSKPPLRENHLQYRLDGMKAAITGLSTGPKPSEKQLRDFCQYMSSALTDVYNDATQHSGGITEEVMAVQAAIDDTAAGIFVNYVVYILYSVIALLTSIFLGIRIAITVCEYAPFWLALLWLMVGLTAYMLLIVIVCEIICHDAVFAGFSFAPAGLHQSASAPAESLGCVFPGPRATCTAPASQEGSPDPSGADQGYLKNLVDLQKEMESKIGEHMGRSSTDMLATKADLASTLFKRGDFEGAAKLYREVWEARNRILGPQHPDTLNSKESLASALLWCGDAINAEKFYREVWETRARVLGPDHPDTRSTKYRLERCTSGAI